MRNTQVRAANAIKTAKTKTVVTGTAPWVCWLCGALRVGWRVGLFPYGSPKSGDAFGGAVGRGVGSVKVIVYGAEVPMFPQRSLA
jgi:hypothetical protein